MPNFGYHIARAQGAVSRRIYSAILPALVRQKITTAGNLLPFEVYSYSGEATLPEQVASIRSFFCHAGTPRKWTIASDGSHTARSIALLKSISPLIEIILPNEWLTSDSSSYLREHSTGKQLALIMSLPRNGPALYVDSDVMFFGEMDSLSHLSYLPDCQLSADQRLFRSEEEMEQPINTGVLFLPKKLDWSLGLERLRELNGVPNFFTNQTVAHLVLHANGARPLDPQRFVLQLDDQFIYPDKYAGPAIALRHYVQPARHKFWQRVWR